MIEARPEIVRTNHSVEQDVVSYMSRVNLDRLRKKFSAAGGQYPTADLECAEDWGNRVADRPIVKIATIASGEKLLRDPQKLLAIRRQQHGKVEVGEMEAVGLMTACRRRDVAWLTIRGISDLGDECKDDRFHPFASLSAALVLADFLAYGYLPLDPGKHIVIDLDRAFPAYGDGELERLRYALAQFLEIPSTRIRIEDVRKGSVKITLRLSQKDADRLLDAYDARDSELFEKLKPLGLRSIRAARDSLEEAPIILTPSLHTSPERVYDWNHGLEAFRKSVIPSISVSMEAAEFQEKAATYLRAILGKSCRDSHIVDDAIQDTLIHLLSAEGEQKNPLYVLAKVGTRKLSNYIRARMQLAEIVEEVSQSKSPGRDHLEQMFRLWPESTKPNKYNTSLTYVLSHIAVAEHPAALLEQLVDTGWDPANFISNFFRLPLSTAEIVRITFRTSRPKVDNKSSAAMAVLHNPHLVNKAFDKLGDRERDIVLISSPLEDDSSAANIGQRLSLSEYVVRRSWNVIRWTSLRTLQSDRGTA